MKRLFFMTTAIIGFSMMTQAQSGYEVGDVVDPFTLQDVSGENVSLNDYLEGQQGVIVMFTCNTCPYAVAYEERIKDLAEAYSEAGWPLLAIQPNSPTRSPGDSFDAMQARAEDNGYGFPYLFDETQDVARAFGATRTPHGFLLQNVDGEFVVRYIGAIDDNPQDPEGVQTKYLEVAIEALENGEDVPRESTRAIGCTIKWAS